MTAQSRIVQEYPESGREGVMIKLTWLPHWKAYAVRCEGGRLIGLVRCKTPLPFRAVVEFV